MGLGNNKDCDSRISRIYVQELWHQCDLALRAYNGVITAIATIRETRGTEGVFFFVHAFLSHAANASKLLWPSKRSAEERGYMLRSEVGVEDSSVIKDRHLRDHLEHYDERLDAWVSQSRRHNLVDTNIGSFDGIKGIDPGDFHRNFDPKTMTFTFMGESYALQPIMTELRDIRQKAADGLARSGGQAYHSYHSERAHG